jgi:hypothetical protein
LAIDSTSECGPHEGGRHLILGASALWKMSDLAHL